MSHWDSKKIGFPDIKVSNRSLDRCKKRYNAKRMKINGVGRHAGGNCRLMEGKAT